MKRALLLSVGVIGLVVAGLQYAAAQGYGGVGFPGGGGRTGLGVLDSLYCQLSGCTMTGQTVYSGVSTDISTENNGTLKLAPAGSGSAVANVQIVAGDSASNTVDWQDPGAFTWSNGTTQGVRLTAGNIDFTSQDFSAWQPAQVRGSTITLAVQTTNNAITMTGLLTLNGPYADYQGTATFSGTQNNYATCTNFSKCRLDGSSTPILTGMTPLAVGERRVLCNVGTVTIQLNHEDVGSTAANRFTLPGAANYNLVAKSCIDIHYDNLLARWLKEAG